MIKHPDFEECICVCGHNEREHEINPVGYRGHYFSPCKRCSCSCFIEKEAVKK